MKNLHVSREEIEALCRRNGVRWLAFFGSVLREDVGPKSEVDVRVECIPGAGVGLFELHDMELELSRILHGRKVDLHTVKSLSKYLRNQILEEAEVQYVQA